MLADKFSYSDPLSYANKVLSPFSGPHTTVSLQNWGLILFHPKSMHHSRRELHDIASSGPPIRSLLSIPFGFHHGCCCDVYGYTEILVPR